MCKVDVPRDGPKVRPIHHDLTKSEVTQLELRWEVGKHQFQNLRARLCELEVGEFSAGDKKVMNLLIEPLVPDPIVKNAQI